MSFCETLKDLLGDNKEETVIQFYNNYNHNRLKN